MSPFCICQSCAFCENCTQELGKWLSKDRHICDYYIFMDDFHFKLTKEEREKAWEHWQKAGGEYDLETGYC